MPQVFKIGSYWVYFWSNENNPLEPIHVHVSQGNPYGNATKIWITQSGKTLLCNNNSGIPDITLRNIMRILEARNAEIVQKWIDYFGSISYYCWHFEITSQKPESVDGNRRTNFFLCQNWRLILNSRLDFFGSWVCFLFGCIQSCIQMYALMLKMKSKRLTDGENLVSEKSEKLRFFWEL